FAEYASTLASAEVTRWSDAWTTFALSEKGWAYQQDQLPSTHPIVADMVDFEAVETNFDGITYAKGASALRQLVAYVGREEFFAGVRAYFAKHAWGNTELTDLLVELEATSGRELSSWAELWLQRSGVNTLRPVIERDGEGTVTRFAIAQEAPEEHPTLRPHRLQVGGFSLRDGALVRTETVELDVDGELTEVPALAGKHADLWLLNDGDLTYAKVRLDAQSLTVAMEHLRDLDDSLARTLLWSAAWDMVRDGELPSRRYQQLVLANLTGEASSSVVRTLLQQLETVASSARHARSATPLATHEGLLRGTATRPGREMDTDPRWRRVISLEVLGGIGAAGIEEQRAAADTPSGRKHALTARAALPTEAA